MLKSVSFTVTTADDMLTRKVEPFALPPSDRFKEMGVLSTYYREHTTVISLHEAQRRLDDPA